VPGNITDHGVFMKLTFEKERYSGNARVEGGTMAKKATTLRMNVLPLNLNAASPYPAKALQTNAMNEVVNV
jgi:hypothetical protein